MPTRPNVLVVMTDQERYPPPYETDAVAEFRRTQLPGRERIRARGVELHRHYVCSTACTPSRASLFTGQYPSLHGLTNTDGLAKTATDPGDDLARSRDGADAGRLVPRRRLRHLLPRQVAHLARRSASRPAPTTGSRRTTPPDGAARHRRPVRPRRPARPVRLPRLDRTGAARRRSVRHRCRPRSALRRADGRPVRPTSRSRSATRPWLAVASFVNPHDIAFAGPAWGTPRTATARRHRARLPGTAVTRRTRWIAVPAARAGSARSGRRSSSTSRATMTYRRLYLWLHKLVDAAIDATLDALDRSGAADDTIVVFTSDHGDLVGAHGGLQQKWFNAYDEAVRVPMVIAGPGIARIRTRVDRHEPRRPAAHAARARRRRRRGADADTVAEHHTEVQALPGRDLSPVLTGRADASELDAPIYFMTEDRITTGLRERGMVSREPYEGVSGNASIESVIAHHDGRALEAEPLLRRRSHVAARRRRRGLGAPQPHPRSRRARQRRARRRQRSPPCTPSSTKARAHNRLTPAPHQLEPTCVSCGVYTPFVDAGSLRGRATSRWWRRGRAGWGRGRSRGSWLGRSSARRGGRLG